MMPFLSAVLIVKNEEKNLLRCLKSLQGVCDEICVVDTGSTDSTVETARSMGAKVSFFSWNGNESDARNASVRMAQGKWVFVIDADEEISSELAQELCLKLSDLDREGEVNSVSVIWRNHYQDDAVSHTRTTRIARNSPEFFFEGNIHPSANYRDPVFSFDGFLEHYGYVWTYEQRKKKSAHMLVHLEPYVQGDRPPLSRLSQYLIYLIIDEQEVEFRLRLDQVFHNYTEQERAHEPYWRQSLANILLHFSEKDDFDSGRVFAEEIHRAHPNFMAALFYLLQDAVRSRQWPRVQDLSQRVLDAIQQGVQTANVIYPHIQGPAARAWLWLAEVFASSGREILLPEDFLQSRQVHRILFAHEKFKVQCSNPRVAQMLRWWQSLDSGQKPADWALEQIIQTASECHEEASPRSAEHILAALVLLRALKEAGKVGEFLSMLSKTLDVYADHRWLAMAFCAPEQWSPRFYEDVLHQP